VTHENPKYGINWPNLCQNVQMDATALILSNSIVPNPFFRSHQSLSYSRIPQHLMEPKGLYYVCKKPPLVPILNQMKQNMNITHKPTLQKSKSNTNHNKNSHKK
jgi:hypothetical protein